MSEEELAKYCGKIQAELDGASTYSPGLTEMSKWKLEIFVSPMMFEYKVAFISKRGLPVYDAETKKVIAVPN